MAKKKIGKKEKKLEEHVEEKPVEELEKKERVEEEPVEGQKEKLKFYQDIGKMGGEKRKQELGHEGYKELGKKGGEAVKKKHGTETLEEVRAHHAKGEE